MTQIQVWVSVNEADIGSIHPGQAVSFTVDTYPNRVFRGKVGKVRYNATMTNNVVTYTVEINTDNSDGKLLPYLTASAKFLVAERDDVLTVPNAALRWMPQASMVAPEFADQLAAISRQHASENAGGSSAGHRSTTRPAATQPGAGRPRTVKAPPGRRRQRRKPPPLSNHPAAARFGWKTGPSSNRSRSASASATGPTRKFRATNSRKGRR